jgi:predicted HicB family RNase H-like nuclease
MGQETRDTESARTIIVRLASQTHKALRIKVAEEDTSIQQWVETLLERELGIRDAGKRGSEGSKSGKRA